MNVYDAQKYFKQINMKEAANMRELFYSNPVLRIVFDIVTNGLLGGGIIFQRKGYTLNDAADRFNNEVWTRFAIEMLESFWCYGFACCVAEEHENFVAIPRVLALDSVNVWVYRDEMNVRFYRVFRRDDEVNPIEDVQVFEMSGDAPGEDGELRSRLKTLDPELQFLRRLETYYLNASANMADPLQIIQQRPEVYNNSNLTMGLVNEETLTKDRGVSASGKHRMDMEYLRLMLDFNRQQVTGMATPEVIKRHESRASNILYLESNEEVKNGSTASASPLLLQYRSAVEEHISALFGVPRSMFAQNSGVRSNDHEANQEMFRNQQTKLQGELVQIIERFYNLIHGHTIYREALSVVANHAVALRESMVTVCLPGIPAPETLTRLYREGTLKYDAYCYFMCRIYHLPVESLEAKPKLDLETVNGLKPDEDTKFGGKNK